MQTVAPASKQIFAKPVEEEIKSSVGIILIDKTKEIPHTAEIINIGSEVKNYKPKDIVIYREYAASGVNLNEEEYILIAEEDVLGKILEVDEK